MIQYDLLLQIANIIINLIDVLLVLLPVLLAVAFMTIIERKQLAAHQRRVGPNTVGYYGILQPFADALKLVVKETIIPSQSNKILFYLAPVSTLIFSLLGWGIIPFGEGLTLFDFPLGILYTLALSSLGVYGVLFAGWSANSKYAFLGSLRSTAAMISYELILSSAILIIMIMPLTDLGRSRGLQFRPLSKIAFFVFLANFLVLMQLGAKHVESPFIEFGQISTVLYFSYFLIIVPLVSLLENTLIELNFNPK